MSVVLAIVGAYIAYIGYRVVLTLLVVERLRGNLAKRAVLPSRYEYAERTP